MLGIVVWFFASIHCVESLRRTTPMRITCLAAVFMLVVVGASAQEQQATNLTLLTTSIQTVKSGLYLRSQYSRAFPSLNVTCPSSTTSCTLAIRVTSHFIFESTFPAYPDEINIEVTGTALPPVDPDATVSVDSFNSCVGTNPCTWSAFGFDWMQRSVQLEPL